VKIVEEPIGTTSIIPMYELSRLAASKVKVVLSGQGADEPLGGYKKYKGLAVLEKMKSNKTLTQLTKRLSPFYKKREKLSRLFSALQAETTLDSYLAYNEILSAEQAKNLLNHNRQEEVMAKYYTQRNIIRQVFEGRLPQSISFQDFFPYYDLRTSLADDLLMYTDKITMHFSMECRVPMLDNDLVDFIESLQTRYKFNASHGKIIHKEFARAYLPDSIIKRKKLGFQSPTALWFRQHKSQLKTLFDSGKLFGGLFDLQSIYTLLDGHSRGANHEKQIFLLLSIFFLMEAECD
jgi:asparagine synthase (glutamine-hydrolysing)